MESAGFVYPEPFRIALITDGLFPLAIGGMQKHSVRLAASIADAGAEVTLFHPHPDLDINQLFSGRQIQKITAKYIPWPNAPKVPGHYLYENYLYSRAVHRELKKCSDTHHAVYVQGFSGWKTICEGVKNTPVVLNFHGMEMFQSIKGFRNRMNGLMLRIPAAKLIKASSAVVSLGGKLSALIEHIAPGQHIIEAPVGIDALWLDAQVESGQPEIRKVLFVGRYEWRKGLDVLNEIIPDLVFDEKNRVRFDFVGAIPEEKRIIHPSVHYHGPIYSEEDLRSIYKEAYLLVCPSYSEGMPTVILEAMAQGLPIIASDVGAVSLLVSEKNGCLVSPGDSNDLKQAISHLLQVNKEEYDKLSGTSLLKVRNYEWDKVGKITLKELVELYRKVSTMKL